jgi:hypothetical protein
MAIANELRGVVHQGHALAGMLSTCTSDGSGKARWRPWRSAPGALPAPDRRDRQRGITFSQLFVYRGGLPASFIRTACPPALAGPFWFQDWGLRTTGARPLRRSCEVDR